MRGSIKQAKFIAKMKSKYFVQSLVMWLGLVYFTNAQSTSCPLITDNDLGNTIAFSTEGLIARAIAPQGDLFLSAVPVRIIDFTIVCDASGDRRDTSSFVSVVVEFQCTIIDDQTSIPNLRDVCDSKTIVIRQYQFQCIQQLQPGGQGGQAVWDTIVSGSTMNVQTENPIATLSTPLANQCRRCIDDQQSSRADTTNHCEREFI